MTSSEAVADASAEQPSLQLEAQDEHFVLPGHELQSQPLGTSDATQLGPNAIPASELTAQALLATAEGSGPSVPERTATAPTASATPSRKEHHLILPSRVRLGVGTRPRPVFSGTTLMLAEDSDGSSLVTSDAPAESPVTSGRGAGEREASVDMNATSSSLPSPAAGGPPTTPSFRAPKQTTTHPPPQHLDSGALPERELCGNEYLYARPGEDGNTGQAATNTSLKVPSLHADQKLHEAPGLGEKAGVQLLRAGKNSRGGIGDVGAPRDENSVVNRMKGVAIGSELRAAGELVTSEMIARLEVFYRSHDPSLISEARRILVLLLWRMRAMMHSSTHVSASLGMDARRCL